MTDVRERRHQAMNFVPDPSEAPFTNAEYAERRVRLRAAMEKRGVDLLYLTSPEAVYYLTGYQAIWYQALALAGWEPISGIALHRDADDLIHIECDREQALTNLTTIAHDLRVWPLGEGDFLAFIIDVTVCFFSFPLVIFSSFWILERLGPALIPLWVAVLVSWPFAYFGIPTGLWGRTLGRWICRLRWLMHMMNRPAFGAV